MTAFELAGLERPDDPATVGEARTHPEIFAKKRVGQVSHHHLDAARTLHSTPAVIGHSSGGPTEQQELPNRGHALTIDHGWQEVVDTALTFIKAHLPAKTSVGPPPDLLRPPPLQAIPVDRHGRMGQDPS